MKMTTTENSCRKILKIFAQILCKKIDEVIYFTLTVIEYLKHETVSTKSTSMLYWATMISFFIKRSILDKLLLRIQPSASEVEIGESLVNFELKTRGR